MPDTDLLSPEGIQKDLSSFRQEIAPLQQQQQQIRQQPLPNIPKAQDVGPAPNADIGNNAYMWVAAASVIGGIAGAFTKNHAMNALTAFTGTLEGLKEGNQQKFENNYKTWEAQSKQAKQKFDEAMAQYKAQLERRDIDDRQKALEIQIIANKHRDTFMAAGAEQAAATGDMSLLGVMYDQALAQGDQFGTSMEKLVQFREQQQMRLDMEKQREQAALDRENQHYQHLDQLLDKRLTGGMGMEGIDDEAQRIATLQQPPYSPAQTKNNPRAASAMARAYQINPDYNPEDWDASKGAVKSLAQGTIGQQVTSISTAINHLDLLDQLGRAVTDKNIPAARINEIRAQAKREFGNVDLSNFDAVKQFVLDEVAKAVIGQKTAESDREQAGKILSAAQTPQQLQGSVQTIKRLLAGRLEPLKLNVDTSTNRPGLLEKRLTPAAKEAMEGASVNRPKVDPKVKQQADNFIKAARAKGVPSDKIKELLHDKAKELGISPEQVDEYVKGL